MPKKRLHRVSVYVLDPDRKRVLLCKTESGPFASQYTPPSAMLNDKETPQETARKLVEALLPLEFDFMGHAFSMPMVLDERSVRIFPPFQVQVTHIDDNTDFVDYVYLAQAKPSPIFSGGETFKWFAPNTLKSAPTHVKHVVHHIMLVMSQLTPVI